MEAISASPYLEAGDKLISTGSYGVGQRARPWPELLTAQRAVPAPVPRGASLASSTDGLVAEGSERPRLRFSELSGGFEHGAALKLGGAFC